MARAGASKIGEVAPPLELPDTEGDVRGLPEPGEASATVVIWTCNHCPYALAWHDRLVKAAEDYGPRGVRFFAVNSNDAERYPLDSLDAMRERAREEQWPFPYLHDESQGAAVAWAAMVPASIIILSSAHHLRSHAFAPCRSNRPGKMP